eukprot:TRINITY_DN1719_c2_g1_i1.p1 TRINITY_DN1719_c2_g1~~TRINITY_DN1719_c2_g1_i1.p1  ORF type:complete len:375 (+),score=67.48 TRINITY_DN1719_c2_g1_i1:1963-3087(+)
MSDLQSEIQIGKTAFLNGRVVSSFAAVDLKPNSIIAEVEKFALTSNNVTYALVGKSFKYFDFFGTAEQADGVNFGIFPVWGVATVVRSNVTSVPVGKKIYGFMPSGTRAVMTVDVNSVSKGGFSALRPHLPKDRAVYNNYTFCDADPLYSEQHLSAMLIYRPLYFTSFFLDDYISYNNSFGAKNVVVISASSKTGFTTGFLLKKNKIDAKVLGLTSKKNESYVGSLDIFDSVMTYDKMSFDNFEGKFVLVDMAGNKRVLQLLANQLEGRIAKTILVGRSHPSGADDAALPKGLNSEFFFAPGWIQKRTAELGQEIKKRMAISWQLCLQNASTWTKFSSAKGIHEGLKAYHKLASGSADPSEGIIVSLKERSSKL